MKSLLIRQTPLDLDALDLVSRDRDLYFCFVYWKKHFARHEVYLASKSIIRYTDGKSNGEPIFASNPVWWKNICVCGNLERLATG